MMPSPAEVRFALDHELLALARDGTVPQVTGIHSVAVENDTVFVGFDLTPGDEILFFEFQRPALVGRDDVGAFAAWLAFSGHGETLH